MTVSRNHQVRRAWIIDTAFRLVAHEGLNALTFRRLSNEMNSSTAAITHYFDNRDALLFAVLSNFKLLGQRDFQENYQNDPRDIESYLISISATTPKRVLIYRAFDSFKGYAFANATISNELEFYYRRSRSRIELYCGNLGIADVNRVAAATRFMTLVMGLSTQRLLDPDAWPFPRLVEEIRLQTRQTLALVRTLYPPPAAPAQAAGILSAA